MTASDPVSPPFLLAAALEHGFTPRSLFSGVGFSLNPGDRLAVTGPNGAGKSTLLRILGGFLRPRRGRVEFRGAPLPGNPEARAVLGWFAHAAALQPSLTGRENLAFALAITRPAAVAMIEPLAAEWGIAELLDRPARSYSEGQSRRFALIRALAGAPGLLLLDEPFSALDTAHRAQLFDTLKTHPAALVFTTHDPEMLALATERIELGAV